MKREPSVVLKFIKITGVSTDIEALGKQKGFSKFSKDKQARG